MAKDLFNRYIWLVDTIYRANGITFEEINEKWLRSSMSDGQDIPLKTFHNHRNAIEEIFDISIVCDRRNGYRYYIENADDMKKGGVRTWLLNTFAVNNLINESHRLKRRILFERIPSGQKHLTTIIEAMRDGYTLEMTYKSFWRQDSYTAEVEPYFVKIFRQRWYMVARNTAKDALRIYALDRGINAYSTLADAAEDISRAGGMRIIFSEGDLSPKVTEEIRELYFRDGVTAADEEIADDFMLNNVPNTLISYTVAPSDPVPGSYCYKMLIDAGTHRLYYYRKQRIGRNSGPGFQPDDIMRITSGRN